MKDVENIRTLVVNYMAAMKKTVGRAIFSSGCSYLRWREKERPCDARQRNEQFIKFALLLEHV